MSSTVILAVAVLSVTLFCSCTEGQGIAESISSANPKRALDSHNAKRSLPNASDMKMLTWDDKLAGEAQAYAEKCNFAHDTSARFVGENIYITTGSPSQLYVAAIENWFSEEEYYDYRSLGCQAGKMCGHYTQIVWADSETLGCGAAFCRSILGAPKFSDSRIVICRYSPPGNFVGEKPYSVGASCNMCPAGWFCNNGLCQNPDTTLTTVETTKSTDSTTSTPTPQTASSTTRGESPTPTTTSTPRSTTTSSPVTTTTRGTTNETPAPTDCTEDYLEVKEQWKEAFEQWRVAFNDWKEGNCPGI